MVFCPEAFKEKRTSPKIIIGTANKNFKPADFIKVLFVFIIIVLILVESSMITVNDIITKN